MDLGAHRRRLCRHALWTPRKRCVASSQQAIISVIRIPDADAATRVGELNGTPNRRRCFT